MYYIEVDVAADPTAEAAIRSLRAEVNPQKIHVRVLELEGPGGGNPLVRLWSNSRTRLEAFLTRHEYDDNEVRVEELAPRGKVPQFKR